MILLAVLLSLAAVFDRGPSPPVTRWFECAAFARTMMPAPCPGNPGRTCEAMTRSAPVPCNVVDRGNIGNELHVADPLPGRVVTFCVRACNFAGCSSCVGN